jgi:hypothetical protein
VTWIESLVQDVRPNVRSLARESLAVAAVVATFARGVGA